MLSSNLKAFYRTIGIGFVIMIAYFLGGLDLNWIGRGISWVVLTLVIAIPLNYYLVKQDKLP